MVIAETMVMQKSKLLRGTSLSYYQIVQNRATCLQVLQNRALDRICSLEESNPTRNLTKEVNKSSAKGV